MENEMIGVVKRGGKSYNIESNRKSRVVAIYEERGHVYII